MNFKSIFGKILNIPPEVVIRKARDRIIDLFKLQRERLHDLENSTFSEAPHWLDRIDHSYYKLPNDNILLKYKEEIKFLSKHYLEHNFNLLGSGWVNVYHGMKATGFESFNYSKEGEFDFDKYLETSFHKANRKIMDSIIPLIDLNYKFIDWQVDFRSGYRYSESQWYKDIKFGTIKGVDIKVPWELGRMQHLICLAYAAKLAKLFPEEFEAPVKYFIEFKNQVLDFIIFNPPRFGVQWMNSMDVGIRAINWLIAYDFFKQLNFDFEENIGKIFRQSIYEHLIHILWNLEWSHGLRANHYFCNIASIIIISSYLPTSEESNTALLFGIQELMDETLFQYYEDGGNFEASIYYHRLTTEFLFHSLFVLFNLSSDRVLALDKLNIKNWQYDKKLKKPDKQSISFKNGKIVLPEQFIKRVENIANFCLDTQNQNRIMSRIGDIDNGRFIKLTPKLAKENEFFEYDESMNPILALYATIFNMKNDAVSDYIEYHLKDRVQETYHTFPEINLNTIQEFSHQFLNSLYPNFGVYIYRNSIYEIFIRCGQIGQNGKGGHSHNDQLSFELSIDGNFIIVDPGNYVYTALPEKRNQFRSTMYHNTLVIPNYEQNKWLEQSIDDLFWYLGERSRAKALKVENNIFIGEHSGYELPHSRIFRLRRDYFTIEDICEVNASKEVHFHLHPDAKVEMHQDEIIIKIKDIAVRLEYANVIAELIRYEYAHCYGLKSYSNKIVLKDIPDEFIIKFAIIGAKNL